MSFTTYYLWQEDHLELVCRVLHEASDLRRFVAVEGDPVLPSPLPGATSAMS